MGTILVCCFFSRRHVTLSKAFPLLRRLGQPPSAHSGGDTRGLSPHPAASLQTPRQGCSLFLSLHPPPFPFLPSTSPPVPSPSPPSPAFPPPSRLPHPLSEWSWVEQQELPHLPSAVRAFLPILAPSSGNTPVGAGGWTQSPCLLQGQGAQQREGGGGRRGGAWCGRWGGRGESCLHPPSTMPRSPPAHTRRPRSGKELMTEGRAAVSPGCFPGTSWLLSAGPAVVTAVLVEHTTGWLPGVPLAIHQHSKSPPRGGARVCPKRVLLR